MKVKTLLRRVIPRVLPLTVLGVLLAFSAIYAKEGGIPAFFAGLGADIAKSAADAFLFFLFYTVCFPFLEIWEGRG